MARVLIVLDIVSCHGPLTLAQVADRVDFSRAAAWRCLDALRAKGWIRMRLGDNAFELTHSTHKAISTAQYGSENAPGVSEVLSDLEIKFNADISLGGFAENGQYSILESTDKRGYDTGNVSYIRDSLALAALSHLDRVLSVRILREFSLSCTKADKMALENGYHAAELRRLRENGFASLGGNSEVSIPVLLESKNGYALRVISKGGASLSADSLLSWLSNNSRGNLLTLIES